MDAKPTFSITASAQGVLRNTFVHSRTKPAPVTAEARMVRERPPMRTGRSTPARRLVRHRIQTSIMSVSHLWVNHPLQDGTQRIVGHRPGCPGQRRPQPNRVQSTFRLRRVHRRKKPVGEGLPLAAKPMSPPTKCNIAKAKTLQLTAPPVKEAPPHIREKLDALNAM